MVASRNNDLYTPFPTPFAVEDGAQSSEDGSGLHSPTFLDKENPLDSHRGEFRHSAPDLDIANVEGLLASHFATPSHTVPAFSAPSYHHPTTSLVNHYPYIHTERDYEDEKEHFFPRPPRAYRDIGLHPNARVPSPSTNGHELMDSRPPMILPALPAGITDQRVYLSNSGEPARVNEVAEEDEYDSSSPVSPQDGQSSNTSNTRDVNSPNRNQPSRREASLVVIACRQCRGRKIRCDSTRPACNNCVRRSNECQYDAVPKRRGPDKRPGTRQRSCKKRPTDGSLPQKKKQKLNSDDQEPPVANTKENISLRLDMSFTGRHASGPHSAYTATPSDDPGARPFQFPSSSASPSTTMSLHAPIPRVARSPESALPKVSKLRGGPFSIYDELRTSAHPDSNTDRKPVMRPYDVNTNRAYDRLHLQTPAVDFNRKVWWDNLLNDYSPTREQSQRDIQADLYFLFTTSNYWLSFVNNKVFFRALWDDAEREMMQPSLILAGLALATLMKSSELGHGRTGRDRAIWLRDAAQASLEASWNASAIDPTLAEAAMILALFESSAHPAHTADRACSALLFLDQIIRALALTAIDAEEPAVSIFPPDKVPAVSRTHQHDITSERRCCCVPQTHSSFLKHSSAPWASTPGWDSNWTVPEIRKEETRRLCWSALTLAAAHTAHCAAFNREPMDLFLIQPENYALLFPGEKQQALGNEAIQSSKQTIWALYCRSMLLWNSCLRLRKGSSNDSEKAEFALQAWLETQEIQDSVDAHICEVDTQLLYMTQEYLFNTRLAITYEFRRLQRLDSSSSPMFNRRQAEEWLYYQNQIAKRFQDALYNTQDPQADVLTRRPFYVWWFMSQLAISMSLWAFDRSLVQALDLSKAFLIPLDIMSALWPCQAQRDRYLELREELAQNCAKAGLPPPSPPDFSIPISLRM